MFEGRRSKFVGTGENNVPFWLLMHVRAADVNLKL